ncbi:hypothetical protein HPB51_018589 [Rhipicephalus microplus]|uniref:THAP-type domain-containing protein n=1 Tax=Rhipicephalus microplus TaxID=6941 RepID=A0A9J6EPQ4_RHIMP|nr:hypothetical protein HPB51_018589 [Rhipicephalus microplus]
MAERRRDKRDRTYFVPHCNSGYRSCKEARSLFRVPADVVKREAWSRLIKRADRELNDASAVCDLHFEVHFIERSFKTTTVRVAWYIMSQAMWLGRPSRKLGVRYAPST